MNASVPSNQSLSLRVKLVLSYLAVALGAIALMIVVVAIAVQSYFYQSQASQLKEEANEAVLQIVQFYQQNGALPDIHGISKASPLPYYYYTPISPVLVDTQGNVHSPPLPASFIEYDSTIRQALIQALHGQEQ